MSTVWPPTNEQILDGITVLADTWRLLAVFWHAYFAMIIIALVLGVRPSKRISCIMLALPFLSVSILAWSITNPFNGIIFAIIAILLIAFSLKLPHEKVQIASRRVMIAGVFMFVFGWVYPPFLDSSSSLSFLYSSPTGVIPCATISIGIGLALLLNGFNSRKPSIILGVSGIIFGITGVLQLGVTIDLFLIFGAVAVLIFAFQGNKKVLVRNPKKRIGSKFSTHL